MFEYFYYVEYFYYHTEKIYYQKALLLFTPLSDLFADFRFTGRD